MEPKNGNKKRPRKTKTDQAVSLDQFSPQEQALITLGADNKNQTIPEFMAEGIRFFIREMVEIRFKANKPSLER